MPNATILSEEPLCLVEVKESIDKIIQRDTELGFLSQKTKEYLDAFVTLSSKQKDDLKAALEGLELTRLRGKHIAKIIDFLPKTTDDLKIILQGYNITLPKKDQDAILDEIKKII